jgi:hypothetical protein
MTATNYPDGVTNVIESAALGTFIAPDPSAAHAYFNDFDIYLATDWTVTLVGTGTQAIVSGDGGLLALVNSAANNDVDAIRLANTGFIIDPLKSFWIKSRLKIDDITNGQILFGLVDTMAAFNPSNGVYMFKNSGQIPTRLSIEKVNVVTSANADSIASATANDTFFDCAITYNAQEGIIKGWINNSVFGTITNLTNLPVVALAPAIGVKNGTAAARTLTVDYLMAAKQR